MSFFVNQIMRVLLMQVANALNNTIRILFNPKIEAFKLFDFLIVKSNENRYLAQITEIYDDKFDASQNVAKIKLFYKIAENNEVMPYDSFTPNKECEIIKIKQEEIEDFINIDKKTFIFATNTKTSTSLKIQYDFFNNNSLILADKVENASALTANLARNLSNERPVVVIDSTGIMEIDNSKTIKAAKNFKLPLNSMTIDFVFDKCLMDASLEFQAVVGEIVNEIKKFAKNQEGQFIPFNAFLKVLLEQYKVTPYPELKLLIARLKKYQMDEIFARAQKESRTLAKSIEKNNVTIIDLSGLDSFWQKAFLEYVIEETQENIYLLTRLNEENCGVDLVNKIYNNKQNIKLVPNISYNYKKLPSIIQYCKNYILLPSLYQRNDFLDANFALANLISDGCILFGENTDNFLYCAKDYSIAAQAKRKNYRKIALSIADKIDSLENIDNEEETIAPAATGESEDSKKLMDELTRFENERTQSSEIIEEFIEDETDKKETFEKIEDPNEIELNLNNEHDDFDMLDTAEQEQNADNIIDSLDDIEQDNSDIFEETSIEEDNQQIAETPTADNLEQTIKENKIELSEIELQEQSILNEVEQNQKKTEITDEVTDEAEAAIEETETLTEVETEVEVQTEVQEENKPQEEVEEKIEEENAIEDSEIIPEDNLEAVENQTLEEETDNKEADNNEAAPLSDEELDFFEENSNEEEDDLNLTQIASNSIDSSFEQIINEKNDNPELLNRANGANTQTGVNIENLQQNETKEDLPIFKEELEKSSQTYEIGSTIYHKTYGKGEIIKLISYEDRQLLQIEFENAGKKLLDPRVADIKTEQ